MRVVLNFQILKGFLSRPVRTLEQKTEPRALNSTKSGEKISEVSGLPIGIGDAGGGGNQHPDGSIASPKRFPGVPDQTGERTTRP